MILISVSLFPVSAATHYEDLISNNVVVGEDNIITLSLPLDQFWTEIINHTTGERLDSFTSSGNTPHVEFTLGDLWGVRFRYMYLSLEDIPDGAVFKYKVKVDSSTPVTANMQALIGLTTGDNQNYIQWLTSEYTPCILGGITENSVTLSKQGFNTCFLDTYIGGIRSTPDSDYRVAIDLLSMEVSFSIKSLVYMQQQSGKTNKLLDEVNKQLEEQGKTMDDILHGTPEQNEGVDESVGELEDSTDRLEQAGDALSSVAKPNLGSINIGIGSLTSVNGVSALTAPLTILWDNSLLLDIVTLVVSISLLSWVFFGKKG